MQRHPQEQGFTLIELLIAMFLGMVVLTAGYTIFVGSNRATREQNQDNRMQDNARMAMDVLSRHFRRAGFMVNFLSYPSSPQTKINGTETAKLRALNSGTAADGVVIVSAPSTSIGVLRRSVPRGSDTLVFTDIGDVAPGDVIGVGLTYTGLVKNADPATNTIILDTSVPTGATNMAYPGVFLEDGVTESEQHPTPLREVNAVTYSINAGTAAPNCGTATHPVLQHIVANSLTCEPIAEDIEDMQIAYGVDRNNNRIIEANEWVYAPAGSDIELIKLARITIVARTAQPDPLLLGVTQTIPAIEDRPARPVTDGYRRFILTRIVKTRNIEAIYSL